LRFEVWGLRFGVWGAGFRVQPLVFGSVFMVQVFKVQGSGFGVQPGAPVSVPRAPAGEW